MKNLSLLILVFIILFSCSRESENNIPLFQYLPANSSILIQTSDLKSYLNQLDSVAFLQKNSFLIPSGIKENLNFLAAHTAPGNAIISFSRDGSSRVQFLFISKDQPEIIIDSVGNRSLETFKYENFEIRKYEVEGTATYVARQEKMFFGSNSRNLLERLLKNENYPSLNDETFKKIQAATDAGKTSFFFNHSVVDSLINSSFPQNQLPVISLAEWSIIEPDFIQDQIYFNGISTWSSESNALLKIFSDVGTQPNEMAKITPSTATGFLSFSYNSFPSFFENLKIYEGTEIKMQDNHILNYSGEAGLIFFKGNTVFSLKATDPDLAREALTNAGVYFKEFRGYQIFNSEGLAEITIPLSPFIPESNFQYYVWLDQFLLLSKTIEALEVIISNYSNASTLWEQENYTSAMENLADASSLLLVANSAEFKPALKSSSSEGISEEIEKLNLEDYPIIALQFVEDKDYAHIHGVLSTTKSSSKNPVNQLKSFTLDAAPATPAFLVKNPTSDKPEVAVQDEENALYLFGQEGNRLWKKSQPGRIIGKIFQVDLFKNGNLQMAFSTSHTLQVLDRNGNNVKPFPLEFKDEITVPLNVFDYENNRTYRFVITQNNNILMYDPKGKAVQGFDFERTDSRILHSPKHFRINKKDYILFPEENGKLNILSRQGKPRITVKGKVDFSENEWYTHGDRFISSTESGEIITVDEKGNIEKQQSKIGNLSLVAGKDHIVTLNENILKVDDKEIALDYGLYTSPRIHNSNGSVFISLTDTQANRVFLFDAKANLLPGFPVYGSSEIEIETDSSGSIIISVQGEGEEIILYEL